MPHVTPAQLQLPLQASVHHARDTNPSPHEFMPGVLRDRTVPGLEPQSLPHLGQSFWGGQSWGLDD